MKRNGIFIKTFIYTAIFAVLLVGVTAFLLFRTDNFLLQDAKHQTHNPKLSEDCDQHI